MELKKCPYCGQTVLEIAKVCKHCKRSLERPTAKSVEKPVMPEKEMPKQAVCRKCAATIDAFLRVCTECGTPLEIEKPPVAQPTVTTPPRITQNKNRTGAIILISVMLVAALSVFGGLYYYKIYLPEKIDREVARYYSFIPALNLRSSKDAGGDYNKICSIPYGTELITCQHDSEWSHVKYKDGTGEEKTGYIASPFLLDKEDFIRLNSIFGDTESKGCVETAKCRIALLNYFKQSGFIGKIPPEVLTEVMPTFHPNDENQWQIFCRDFKLKPNNVLYPKLYNKDSKFTDFAVIIKNINTDARRLLLFYFDDDETPHLYHEEPVYGQGYIVSIKAQYDSYSDKNYIVAKYSELNESQAKSVENACFVIISKQNMTLQVFDYKGQEKCNFPIACGKNFGNKRQRGDMKTPEGVFRVSEIQNSSGWKHDFKDGQGEIEGAYGPYFIRLYTPGHSGIGIHGTHDNNSLGTRATEGCIRLQNENLLKLVKLVRPGTVVVISPSKDDLAE
jgi:lipoprotein-anchoring transpeptidase ErfK/SrfK